MLAAILLAGSLIWIQDSEPFFFKSNCDFENEVPNWRFEPKNTSSEIFRSGKKSFLLDTSVEFSATFSAKTSIILNSSNDKISTSFFIYAEGNLISPKIVVSVENGDSALFWISSELSQYKLIAGEWNKISFSAGLPELEIKGENTLLKCYVWNPEKDRFFIDDFEIQVIPVIP